MRHRIIIALGILAAITGLSHSVQARPAASNAEVGEYTLSGESVFNLGSRTIEDDYKRFFGIENPANISLSRDDVIATEGFVYADGDDGAWALDDNLELHVNEPISPAVGIFPFRPEGASLFDGVESVEVQTELN